MIRDRSQFAIGGHQQFVRRQPTIYIPPRPLIRPSLRPQKPYQLRDVIRSKDPLYIFFGVEWMDYLFSSVFDADWFIKVMPPRQIIEIVTSVPVYDNYENVFWCYVEELFDLDTISSDQLNAMEIFTEVLMTHFYQELDQAVPNLETGYVFKEWVDNNTLLMVRDDNIDGALNQRQFR